MLLFEMIALHLDAADGKCSIWEEFAECFRGLLTAILIEYEDCTSINPRRGETNKICANRIPRFFFEGNARGTWKLRFHWWKTRHFGGSSLLDQSGDQNLLCFKAACASHLYGPTYETEAEKGVIVTNHSLSLIIQQQQQQQLEVQNEQIKAQNQKNEKFQAVLLRCGFHLGRMHPRATR